MTTTLQAAPNSENETYQGYRNPENMIVVSDAYPTVTAMAADIIRPAAMQVEKEGVYGNAWLQLVDAPGEARSDLWQLAEFSKRFATDEVWPEEILDANPEYRGGQSSTWPRSPSGHADHVGVRQQQDGEKRRDLSTV